MSNDNKPSGDQVWERECPFPVTVEEVKRMEKLLMEIDPVTPSDISNQPNKPVDPL